MEQNTYKKSDANGNKLPVAIGKGLDQIHADKAVKVRTKLVGCYLTPSQKQMFILACEELDLKQSDVFNLAVNETILKASEL
ncbi:MAG: hypothetical protein HRT87_09495 [Legionellales bacterium]|nr:hypothetical protein [Legionellales bacterium]